MRRLIRPQRSMVSTTRSMTETPAIGTSTLLATPAALASGSFDGDAPLPCEYNRGKSLFGCHAVVAVRFFSYIR